MSSTQRLNTGRSSQFADSGGGISMADAMLLKPFFSDRGLLPPSTLLEDLYEFPARDFEFLSTGSLDASISRVKLVTPNNNQLTFGWDIGAAKSKVLAILGLAQPGFATAGAGIGLFITGTAQDSNAVKSAYKFQISMSGAQAGSYQLYKTDGSGNETSLDNNDKVTPSTLAPSALAFYYDDATDRLLGLIRRGSECWWPVCDITDTTFTTMRYIGILAGAGGTPTMWAGCPLAIYHS